MNTIVSNRIPSYSPLRQGGLDTAGSGNLGPMVAQRQINGLRAGVQTGHALAAQCVLAACWWATGRPGPRVGGQGEAWGRAGGQGVGAQVWGFAVQRAAGPAQAAAATQASCARGGGVQAGLPRQCAVGAAQNRRALARVGGARRAGLAAGFGTKQSGGREAGGGRKIDEHLQAPHWTKMDLSLKTSHWLYLHHKLQNMNRFTPTHLLPQLCLNCQGSVRFVFHTCSVCCSAGPFILWRQTQQSTDD